MDYLFRCDISTIIDNLWHQKLILTAMDLTETFKKKTNSFKLNEINGFGMMN